MAILAKTWLQQTLTPCADTIAGWVMRLCYSQLNRPLPVGPWAWFVDLTMTIGPAKVLVIAGCPLAHIPFGVRALAPSDLYLVHVAVLQRSSHDTILPHLQQALTRTGTPRSITTDEGSDIGKAVPQLSPTGPQVIHLLDMAHIGANLLKKRWTADPRWKEFLQQLTLTNQRLRQTELAYLVSPRLRDKGRFMSVRVVLRFAQRVLTGLDRGLLEEAAQEKYGWLTDFREDVAGWHRQQQLVEQTVAEVRENGWEKATLTVLEALWEQATATEQELVEQLRTFARKMVDRVGDEETLPGSTEVLESGFGRWKRMIEAGPSVGPSRLVLSLGAVFKPLEPEVYAEVLEETPLKKVLNWVNKQIGTTMQKLRSIFYKKTAPPPLTAVTKTGRTNWVVNPNF